MTHEVGAEADPASSSPVRERLSADRGDRELPRRDGDVPRSTETKADIVARLIGSLDDHGRPSMSDMLLAERRLDRKREDRKLGFDS